MRLTPLALPFALLVSGLPVAAQRTTFEPSISLAVDYEDNVNWATDDDVASGVKKQDDSALKISVELPVRREGRRGSIEFSYAPSYVQQRDADQLDRDEHRVRFGWTTKPSQRTDLSLSAGYRRTQEQSTPGPLDEVEPSPDADLFVTSRTEKDVAELRFGFDHEAGQLWSWGFGASFEDRHHEAIEGLANQAAVTDRSSWGGGVKLARTISRRSSLGVSLDQREFDLKNSGNESSTALSLNFRQQVSRNTSLNLALGGFYSRGEAADGTGTDDERTGGTARLSLQRAFRRWDLGLSASHRPSAGGDLDGTSTDTRIEASLAGSIADRWSWSVSPRVGRSDPADSSAPERDTVSLSAGIERRFVGIVAMRFDAFWVDQSEASDSVSNYGGGLGIVIHPLGRTALGGRS